MINMKNISIIILFVISILLSGCVKVDEPIKSLDINSIGAYKINGTNQKIDQYESNNSNTDNQSVDINEEDPTNINNQKIVQYDQEDTSENNYGEDFNENNGDFDG